MHVVMLASSLMITNSLSSASQWHLVTASDLVFLAASLASKEGTRINETDARGEAGEASSVLTRKMSLSLAFKEGINKTDNEASSVLTRRKMSLSSLPVTVAVASNLKTRELEGINKTDGEASSVTVLTRKISLLSSASRLVFLAMKELQGSDKRSRW